MRKRQKKKLRQRASPPRPTHARNPGVSSLLLVNPAPKKSPRPALDTAKVSNLVKSAVATALKDVKGKMPKKGRRKAPATPKKKRHGKRSHRPASAHLAQPTVQISVGGDGHTKLRPGLKREQGFLPLDMAKRYRGFEPRKTPYRGKVKERGKKTLERNRKSILWNVSKGSPTAQKWVLDHIPKMNPGRMGRILGDARADVKGVGKEVAIGAATFLGARILSNVAHKIPGLSRLGPHGAVLASALLGVGSWLLGRKFPTLKKPLLYGTTLAFVDSLLKNYVPQYLPSAAGVLGATDPYAALQAYEEPMGYLPAYDPMNGVGCAPRGYAGMADLDGMGIDVHEAMADAGDGLGIDVHEAMAGAGDSMDGFDVHEAQAGYGAYLPAQGTGAIDPSVDGMGAYYPSGTGAYYPSGTGAYVPTAGLGDARDAAAFMFGGPGALMHWKLHERRRRQMLARRRALMQQRGFRAPPNGEPQYPANGFGHRYPPGGEFRHYPPPHGGPQPPPGSERVRAPANCEVLLPPGWVPSRSVSAPPPLPSPMQKSANSMMGVPGGIFATSD